MRSRFITYLITSCFILTSFVNIRAGGPLETIDITNAPPSPIADQLLARVIGIRWDSRCIPVQYRVNNTLNPIPNPLGAPFLSVADATTALQSAFDNWNAIPTSFMESHIIGTRANAGLAGFDFVNELTFRTGASFNAIASSPSTALIRDTTLTAGTDIDVDGDSDVSAGITTATDTDSDGDIEFPAGFYKAGTILDNDVQFNTKTSNGFRFTVDPAQADTVTRSIDLIGTATHEFGHSLGLSHVLSNQSSATDGNGATMFPFIDTGDPPAELANRTLDIDDIAFASYFYPEGSSDTGPAALQAGDVAFDSVFGLIKGELTHGVLNQPIAGGSLYAVDRNTDVVTVNAFSGTTNVSVDPATGALSVGSDVSKFILNGNYVIPVPQGNYDIGVEAVDGAPVPAVSINFTTLIGTIFGQQNFVEEFWNDNDEAAVEREPGVGKNVHANAGHVNEGINIVTNNVINISNFGAAFAIGFVNSPPGRTYAVAFPASQISAINPGQDILVQAGRFDTAVVDASVPVVFAKAVLTTGVINPDGTANIDLVNPLEVSEGFLGQDRDFASFFFKNPHELGRRVRSGIASGEIQNLFLVLQIPTSTPFPGVSGQPPLIALNNTGTLFGLSFLSNDGGLTFTRIPQFNFRFSLMLSEPTS